MERILNVPPRGIGQRSVDELNRWSRTLNVPMRRAVEILADDPDIETPIPRAGKASLARLGAILKELQQAVAELEAADLLDRVLDRTGYRTHILSDDEQGEDRWDNVRELQHRGGGLRGRPATRGARGIPGAGGARFRRRQRGAKRWRHPHHPAPGQGVGVSHHVHGGHGRGHAPAYPLLRRPRRDGGGAAPLLRGHDPCQGAALPNPSLSSTTHGQLPPGHTLALPERHSPRAHHVAGERAGEPAAGDPRRLEDGQPRARGHAWRPDRQ